jgi:hypothetical protein
MTKFAIPPSILRVAADIRQGHGVATDLIVHRYVRATDPGESALYAAIVMLDQRNTQGDVRTLGAYLGYAGGGSFQDGVFIVDANAPARVVVLIDDEEINASDDKLIFEWLMLECGRLYEYEDETYVLSVEALELLEGAGYSEVFMDEGFDGDLLAGVSEQWGMLLRFKRGVEIRPSGGTE